MRDRPREQEVERGAAALLEHDLEELAERVAADEERQRLVLVRRPGEQLVEEEGGGGDGERGHAEREPVGGQPRARRRCLAGSCTLVAWAVSLMGAVDCRCYLRPPCRSTSTAAPTGTCSSSSSG